MSSKRFSKGGVLTLAMLAAVIVLLPFAIEQVADAFGYYFPATSWVMGLFSSKQSVSVTKEFEDADWDNQIKDLKEFSEWAGGLSEVKISIVRPEMFQIVRANPNPATESSFSWKLHLISDTLSINAEQVRNKLVLICDDAEKVSGSIKSVKPLGGGEKGFLVTINNVRGEGKIGLSYDGMPPVYYDVKLRKLWLVPVASCRSAMNGRYESAVFFPGMKQGLPEGAIISPGPDKCGYRILSVSDHCVWFEAFYGDTPTKKPLPQSIWPDFSRVDTLPPTPPPGRLIFGKNRCFWPGDAIKLPKSHWYLQLDDLVAGKAVVFRLLNSTMHPVRELMCVIVREK